MRPVTVVSAAIFRVLTDASPEVQLFLLWGEKSTHLFSLYSNISVSGDVSVLFRFYTHTKNTLVINLVMMLSVMSELVFLQSGRKI